MGREQIQLNVDWRQVRVDGTGRRHRDTCNQIGSPNFFKRPTRSSNIETVSTEFLASRAALGYFSVDWDFLPTFFDTPAWRRSLFLIDWSPHFAFMCHGTRGMQDGTWSFRYEDVIAYEDCIPVCFWLDYRELPLLSDCSAVGESTL